MAVRENYLKSGWSQEHFSFFFVVRCQPRIDFLKLKVAIRPVCFFQIFMFELPPPPRQLTCRFEYKRSFLSIHDSFLCVKTADYWFIDQCDGLEQCETYSLCAIWAMVTPSWVLEVSPSLCLGTVSFCINNCPGPCHWTTSSRDKRLFLCWFFNWFITDQMTACSWDLTGWSLREAVNSGRAHYHLRQVLNAWLVINESTL